MITAKNHELVRVSNIDGESHIGSNRLTYYTSIKFLLDGIKISVTCKVDTGSPYTIIGTRNKCWKTLTPLESGGISKIYNELQDSGKDMVAATGDEFKTKSMKVSNLSISGLDLSIPMNILVADGLGDNAILGMDILTLFQFKYTFDGNSKNGTIWLVDVESTKDRLDRLYKVRGEVSFAPYTIMSINDVGKTKRSQVGFGEYLTLDI